MLVTAFAAALAQVPALQQPQQPAQASASVTPAVAPQLPTNVIKLPTFYGTVSDPSDSKQKSRSSPASVVSMLSRMDAYFETYASSYPTEDLKLNALLACFPPNSAAQFWYESDVGKSSFRTYDDFKVSFAARFGATAADKAKYQADFFHIRQLKNEPVHAFNTRFFQLVAEMKAIGQPVDSSTQVARYIDGLSPVLRPNIHRIQRTTQGLTLDAIMSEAEMEEKLNPLPKLPHVPPAMRGMQTKPNKPAPKGRKKCFYCSSEDHIMKNCPKVAKKKANGTWHDRPQSGAGPSS
jgi:hypothetical protein